MEEKKKISLTKPEPNTEDLVASITIKDLETIRIAADIDGIELQEYARRAVCAAPTKRSRAKETEDGDDIQGNQEEEPDQPLRVKVSKTDFARIKEAALKKGLTQGEFFRKAAVTEAWRHILANKDEACRVVEIEFIYDYFPQMLDWLKEIEKKNINKKS